jgi:hypothetical protein
VNLSAQEKSFKYVGVKKCKTCHKKAKDGEQYKIWSEGPHAKAMKTLSSEKALKFAKENGIADPAKEPKCLKCHSTAGATDIKLHEKTLTIEEGVSCESCHGPGSEYKKKKTMKNHELSLKNGLIIPNEKTCITCHTEEGNAFFKPFDFEKRVKKIAHPIPSKKQ